MFRTISGVALSLIFTVALHAADEPKPNTLTPKEIAEGWILLFDGETTFGWKIEGDVRAHDGLLVLSGDKDTSIQTACNFGSDFQVTFEFTNNDRQLEAKAGLT